MFQNVGCPFDVDVGSVLCKCKIFFLRGREKEHEGEDLYGTHVPALPVELCTHVHPHTVQKVKELFSELSRKNHPAP